MYNILFQPVGDIILMKVSAQKALDRLGISVLRDLLFYKPYNYNIIDTSSNLSKIDCGTLIQAEIIINTVELPKLKRLPTRIYTSNNTGELALVFFNKIPPFILAKLKQGKKYVVAGKVQKFDGIYQINHPEFIFNKSLVSPVEAIYHLTYGLTNKQLYNYIFSGIAALEVAINARVNFGNIIDIKLIELQNEKLYMDNFLSEIKSLHLIGVEPDHQYIESLVAKNIKKLSIKELFANQVSLLQLKNAEQKISGYQFPVATNLQTKILDQLGFILTTSQKQVIEEIQSDQNSEGQMMRLLQGDVGSGKTLVALMTMLNVVDKGYQVAFMAPTDLLAIQHFQFFQRALSNINIKFSLLTGKTKIKDRREINSALKTGEIKILIGTHALFQESVILKNLGYIVIDEQHRFGVNQRLELVAKGLNPDLLVMTATPIPRSLTLTMFGDMSISSIKAKPKNRQPIITKIIPNNKREQVLSSLKTKIDQGEKIYWVCPLIDSKDKISDQEVSAEIFANVTDCFLEIEKLYPGIVGILHGKMKITEKDRVMQDFKNNKIKILIATTVVEVGIDIQSATLMVIENAENFGLAQLHQLRGRVGRGSLQSYCILIYNPNRMSLIARKRLKIMRNSNDGFYISEQDLLLRGGGEILGTRQSGEPQFFFADLGKDVKELVKVNKLAKQSDNSEFISFQTRLFARDKVHLVNSG